MISSGISTVRICSSDTFKMLPGTCPQLSLHVAVDLVAPTVEPSDIEVSRAHTAHAVRLNWGHHGVDHGWELPLGLGLASGGDGRLRQCDDASLLEAVDLTLEANIDGLQGRKEVVRRGLARSQLWRVL